MTVWNLILAAAIVIIIALPPSYDPAIRLKEWAEKKKRK